MNKRGAYYTNTDYKPVETPEKVYGRAGLKRQRGKITPLARAIREARKQADLTQQDLADATGIPRGRLAQYETGTRRIPFQEARKLRDHFGADWQLKAVRSTHHDSVAELEMLPAGSGR